MVNDLLCLLVGHVLTRLDIIVQILLCLKLTRKYSPRRFVTARERHVNALTDLVHHEIKDDVVVLFDQAHKSVHRRGSILP